MTTIFSALNQAAEQLKKAQKIRRQTLENPKLDAQVLLAHCLNKPTAYLFAHGDETLTEAVHDRFFALIDRRAKHEPVAYLIAEREFCRRPFVVSTATLIPRPETELLVELAIKTAKPGTVFADIGTGSGAIAVTLAAETGAFVFATDVSGEALLVAKHNAERHQVADRIFFLQGDLLTPFLHDLKAWLERAELKQMTIVANLPYISKAQYETLDPDVKNYEPATALLGGLDGLALYDRLFKQIDAHRACFPPNLKVMFEIDPSQNRSAPLLVRHYFPRASVEVIDDLAGRARIVNCTI